MTKDSPLPDIPVPPLHRLPCQTTKNYIIQKKNSLSCNSIVGTSFEWDPWRSFQENCGDETESTVYSIVHMWQQILFSDTSLREAAKKNKKNVLAGPRRTPPPLP